MKRCASGKSPVQLKSQLRTLTVCRLTAQVRAPAITFTSALVHVPSPRGVAAINPNAKYCEATERAAILPKQWPYSVIARSHHAPGAGLT